MARKITSLICAFCMIPGIYAQTGMGFSEIRHHTHALVIGISDYKNIPDLEFADRDALAFRDYLHMTLDSKQDTSNIVLLLNDKAISPNIYKSLENLVSMAREGDRVYIYFSGHGDSENVTLFRSGFLLTYDTPAESYYTNSINVDILNHFINTLSTQNKADVIFIADACRSGNMAMTQNNGAIQTARVLSSNVADEVRMLSCQPNEISLEGKQWGNGRGLFSYHLVNGLFGMADNPQQNGDGRITLNELNIYLSTKVPNDASPVSQYPGVYGPMSKSLGRTNPTICAALVENDQLIFREITSAAGRAAYIDKYLTMLSQDQLNIYNEFKQALDKGNLLPGKPGNAYDACQRLRAEELPDELKQLLLRDLIAALQQNPQIFINQLADINKKWNENDTRYDIWAEQIRLSAELLGPEHYMFNSLMSKFHFFLSANNLLRARRTSNSVESMKLAGEAVREANAAIALDNKVTFYHNMKGAALSQMNRFDLASSAYDEAILLNPEYPYPYSNKGFTLMKQGKFEEALPLFDRTIELDPYYTTAYQYKATSLTKLGRTQEAAAVYQKLLEISSGKVGM